MNKKLKECIVKMFSMFHMDIYNHAIVEESVLEEGTKFIMEVTVTARSLNDLGKIIAVLNDAYDNDWDWFEQFDIIIRSSQNKVIFQKRY